MEVSSRLVKIAGFVAPAYRAAPNNALLLCLCANDATSHAAAMPRSPEPLTGFTIDDRFAEHYANALNANPEIHDGAIMARRNGEHYTVFGWSYRLFPPSVVEASVANRGSAFHSCLAMSALADIDGVLLFSANAIMIFRNGGLLQDVGSVLSL
jgi:hypothetical protein